MNKLNPKDLTAAVPAVAATVALYAACAAVLWMLSEVMMV